jgi:hypothetical protein
MSEANEDDMDDLARKLVRCVMVGIDEDGEPQIFRFEKVYYEFEIDDGEPEKDAYCHASELGLSSITVFDEESGPEWLFENVFKETP